MGTDAAWGDYTNVRQILLLSLPANSCQWSQVAADLRAADSE